MVKWILTKLFKAFQRWDAFFMPIFNLEVRTYGRIKYVRRNN